MKRFFRTHVRSVVITAVVVVCGAIGLTIGLLSTGSSKAASAAPTTVAPPTTAAPAAGGSGTGGSGTATKPAKRKVPRVRGTITALTPTSWTLTTAKGATLTVTIGADTKYGMPKAPATASTFATGQSVIVVGTRNGTTVTATRIVMAPLQAAGGSTTAPTSPAG